MARPPDGADDSRAVADAKAAAREHFHGHRQRVRERFEESGGRGFRDYELLELLLFQSIPQADTKALAKRLVDEFGSFAEVLGASAQKLGQVPGIGRTTAINLKVVHASAQRLLHGAVAKREVLSSWTALLDYCRAAMAFGEREQFRILFLDKRNALIADELQQEGTVDHTPVYPREVVRRALELSATAVILVHNHPSGDPTPSAADIAMTRQIVEVARPLGIAVHDHVIVGRNGHVSMKGQKLI